MSTNGAGSFPDDVRVVSSVTKTTTAALPLTVGKVPPKNIISGRQNRRSTETNFTVTHSLRSPLSGTNPRHLRSQKETLLLIHHATLSGEGRRFANYYGIPNRILKIDPLPHRRGVALAKNPAFTYD